MSLRVAYFAALALMVGLGCSASGGQSGTEASDVEGNSPKDAANVGEMDAGAEAIQSADAAGAPVNQVSHDGFTQRMLGADSWLVSLPNDRASQASAPGKCAAPELDGNERECLVQQRCENGEFTAHCDYDGETECTCSTSGREHRFWLSRALSSPCDAVIQPCREGNIVYAEPVCSEPAIEFDGTTSCSAKRNCEVAMTVGGLDALKHDAQDSWCMRNPRGGVDCSCSTTTDQASYHFTDDDLEAGCKLALDICAEATDASRFSRTPDCRTQVEVYGDTSCILASTCRYEDALSSEVTRTALDSEEIACEYKPETDWRCYCGQRPWIEFDVAVNHEGAGVCAKLPHTCLDLQSEVVFRDGSCAPPTKIALEHECIANVECELASELDGFDVRLREGFSVSCTDEDPTLGWKCTCDGPKYQSFSVAADSSADACDAALDPCRQLIREWADSLD